MFLAQPLQGLAEDESQQVLFQYSEEHVLIQSPRTSSCKGATVPLLDSLISGEDDVPAPAAL